MIELSPGELKELNVAMQPKAAPPPVQIVIDELFIGTWLDIHGEPWGAADALYVALRNTGLATVSGVCNIYDWQAWWHHAPGDDRLWDHKSFTIDPGGIYRIRADDVNHLYNDLTYMRVDVVVNDAIILATPRIYIEPGRHAWSGSAEAACIYKQPGLAVFWYCDPSSVGSKWSGLYRTPPRLPYPQPYDHYGEYGPFNTYDYPGRDVWDAVFFPIMDPGFIAGAPYRGYINGRSLGLEDVWFDFTF